MHIVHLALAVDAITSILIDLVQIPDLILGGTRDQRLGMLWNNYQEWCESIRHLLAKKHRLFFYLERLNAKKRNQQKQIPETCVHIHIAKYKDHICT